MRGSTLHKNSRGGNAKKKLDVHIGCSKTLPKTERTPPCQTTLETLSPYFLHSSYTDPDNHNAPPALTSLKNTRKRKMASYNHTAELSLDSSLQILSLCGVKTIIV